MTRSYLYVPADRPDRLVGALERGADAVIADLEDGVAPAAKDEARRHALEWLAAAPAPGDGSIGPQRWVRINSDDRTIGDLDAVVHANLAGIVLPKATLRRLSDLEETITYLENECGIEALSVRVNALIESAQGILDAVALAAHHRVDRLAVGEADLTAELGIHPTTGRHGLWPLRMQLVVASAAAAIAAPVAPVQTNIADIDQLRWTSEELAAAGFGARSAIHPTQIPIINEVFAPSAEDIAWAEQLIADFAARTDDGLGVFTDAAGSMVDEAVVRRARRIVAAAGR
jgi:citrate lyase subunit beta/citryl-CoA lyase